MYKYYTYHEGETYPERYEWVAGAVVTKKERRHIKYKAEITPPLFETVKVTITEQTHFGENFNGKSKVFNHKVEGEENINLYSLELGRISEYEPGLHYRTCVVLLFRPSDVGKVSFELDKETYDRFKQAVKAYNEFHDVKEPEKEKSSIGAAVKKVGVPVKERPAKEKVEPWRAERAYQKVYFGGNRKKH